MAAAETLSANVSSHAGRTCPSDTARGTSGGREDDRHDLAASHCRARDGSVAGFGSVKAMHAATNRTTSITPVREAFKKVGSPTRRILG